MLWLYHYEHRIDEDNPIVIQYKLNLMIGGNVPIGAIIGGCVGGVILMIILFVMYFFYFRKVNNENAIGEKSVRMHVDEILLDFGIHEPYGESIPSAPPSSSPWYNDTDVFAGREIPLIFESKPVLTYSCVCCSDFKLHVGKGVMCSNIDYPHFICNFGNKDCFSTMITSQTKNKFAFMKNGNYIICAYCTAIDSRVVSPFDLARVVKHANPIALAAYKYAVSESVNAALVCMICMERPKVIALIPCGHKAYCAECFVDPILGQENCPYCRTAVTETIRLYD
jgi:hypothetical protein